MNRRLLALACLVASSSIAGARPSVTVTGDVPFSDRELGDALELRVAPDLPVVISTGEDGRLVIEVEGRRQVIDAPDGDSHSSARVVALVVLSLVGEPTPPPAFAPPRYAAPAVAASSGLPSLDRRHTFRIVPSILHGDGGYNSGFVTASAAVHIAPSARVVGSIGYGRELTSYGETGIPLKLGIEGLSGNLGVELGGFAMPIFSCDTTTSKLGVYGMVHLYVPVSPRARVVIEGGGEFALAEAASGCYGALSGDKYGGQLGLGGEWAF